MNSSAVLGFFTLLFGVAIVAVIVSQKAQTSAVVEALGKATSDVLGAATAPVTA